MLSAAKIPPSFSSKFSYYLYRTSMRPLPPFLLSSVLLFCALPGLAQDPTVTASIPAPESNSFAKEPYVFEELKSAFRFDADGKGRRELTARVRIQSESATHDFGLLTFSYAASFESLDINYIRVRK